MFGEVRVAVGDGVTVDFLGKWGGIVPTEAEVD